MQDMCVMGVVMSLRRIAFVVIGIMAWMIYLSEMRNVDLLRLHETIHGSLLLPSILVFLCLAGIAIFFVRKD